MAEKWRAFGWAAKEIDGHDFEKLESSLTESSENGSSPSVIIANTIKGKGVSFMQDDNNWHYRIPTESEVKVAKQELNIK